MFLLTGIFNIVILNTWVSVLVFMLWCVPPADLATVKVISEKMGKNEDLLVFGFGVEYVIDIVVFAGDDDGESAIRV